MSSTTPGMAPQEALRVILGTLGQVKAVVQRILGMTRPAPASDGVVLRH